jgi:hypothetical protein
MELTEYAEQRHLWISLGLTLHVNNLTHDAVISEESALGWRPFGWQGDEPGAQSENDHDQGQQVEHRRI